jgi:biotin carboxylase
MSRLLLLLPTSTYRTKAFMDAALRLGVELVVASEQPNTLGKNNPGLLTLNFFEEERAVRDAADYARERPVDAIVPVDDDTAITAASIARALNLEHNSIESVRTAKNKQLMREALKRADLPVPRFWHFTLDDNPKDMAARVTYPCVVKPVILSTSRGVMRVDDETQFVSAIDRLRSILERPDVLKRGAAASRDLLVEEFIPGFEIALEGLLSNGELKVLAIFDKPDPLDGPFFEETIYVTPSRLSIETQREIIDTTKAATRAMGLTKGPIHAELRINEKGSWVVEIAARSIGGLCARALRFGDGLSLEDLILRHALGRGVDSIERERLASGVMMIPIPRRGILREVRRLDEAMELNDIEDIVITAHITQELLPPPEGSSYLGFIFSRAETPERVESALREAHKKIEFVIDPLSGEHGDSKR